MVKRYVVDVPGVPKSPSPISNAVVIGNTCHISGQLSVYDDGYRAGSAKEETTRAFDLVFKIANECGFERNDIVYVDIAFKDLGRDIADVNAVYESLFVDRPARTIYQAAKLPFDAKIKVQAIAMKAE